MIRWGVLVLVSWLAWAPVGAQAALSLANLDALEDAALADRLLLIREKQLTILRLCQRATRAAVGRPVRLTPSQMAPYFVADRTARRAALQTLIGEIQASGRGDGGSECERTLAARSLESIRDPLTYPYGIEAVCLGSGKGCVSSLWKWYAALAPSCYQVRQKGLLNQIDSNACFAGDGLILAILKQQSLDPISDTLMWSQTLLETIAAQPDESALDLETVFRQSGFTHPTKALLALTAAVGSSGNSGVTGWLQGVEDHLLMADLKGTRQPQDVYVRYKLFQAAKIMYQKFRTLAERKKIQLKLSGHSITHWNRHNLMAAFLACSAETGSAERNRQWVEFTGKGYEAMDFVSHLVEGAGWSASMKNWTLDTARYREGGKVGLSLCF